jgi:hypothetical protein
MKALRLEIVTTARVYFGEQHAFEVPTFVQALSPDVETKFTTSRVIPLGLTVNAPDAAAGHVVGLLANISTVLAERVRWDVKKAPGDLPRSTKG